MTRGRLNLPDIDQQWQSPGGKAPAGGKIYTDFPEEAVARLRAANSTPSVPPPWRKGAKTARKPAPPAPAPKPAPTPPPSAQAEPLPLVTMNDFEGGDNREKGAFIRRHFPSWLAYQETHGLQRKDMLALTGVAGSVWYNHQLGYRKHPERYGEQEPAVNETAESLQKARAEVQAGEVHPVETLWDGIEEDAAELAPTAVDTPADEAIPQAVPQLMGAAVVGKIRELNELVGELRAAGAVVQVSVNWTIEL